MSSPVLLDIGSEAYAHQAEVDEVKQRMGISHNYFDCWIFGFLENKNYNIDETVAKLQRRAVFERDELSQAEITDWMMENMKKGIIQVIGNDKAGRVAFYICTARDKPQSKYRAESRKNFDMFISYGTRLRMESKRCQMTMLINQDKASMFSNLDMTFQADIALRIAKYYPGCVDKMYICKMGRTLSALAKPIFSSLPSIVSDRIIIISDGDIKRGKLLELFDEDVLPITLGGKNDCDHPENYSRFAHTIKDYFELLKAAIHRGMGVKEWELENLRAAGLEVDKMTQLQQSMMANSDRVSRLPTDGEQTMGQSWASSNVSVSGAAEAKLSVSDTEDLVTCETYSPRTYKDNYDDLSRTKINNIRDMISLNLFSDSLSQCMTIETFFRISLEELSEREWIQIVQREIKERRELQIGETQFRGDSLFTSFPLIVQYGIRGFVWLCMTVMSFNFLIGTLFLALLGVLTSVYVFFSMFSKPYYVFPYGAAFLVVVAQFTILCSRGFDVTRNVCNGHLIEALRAFGRRALLFQVFICVLGLLGFFVLFCVMASRYDVLTGIQYSLAYGWITAACLIFIYHVVFAFGSKAINKPSYNHGSRVNNATTALYLIMDIDIDDSSHKNRPLSEIISISIIGLLVLASGVSSMAGGGFFFLLATIVTTAVLLIVNVVVFSVNNSSSTATLTICAIAYACIFWIDATFTMDMYGWQGDWGNSLLTALFIMLFVVIVCFVGGFGHWKGKAKRWLFRVTWILLVLHLIGCVVVLIVFNYRMGLFVMALAIHILICIFRTNEASNNYGLFLMGACFTFALLTCCLIAEFNQKEVYVGPIMSDYPFASALVDPSVDSSLSRPLICSARFAGGEMDVLSMALLAKVGYNKDVSSQISDLQRLFPGFERVGNIQGSGGLIYMSIFRYVGATQNTTFLAVRPGSEVQNSINLMSTWIDVYLISFFGFLMPPSYVEAIVPYLTFALDMSPLTYKNYLKDVSLNLTNYMDGIREDEKVYVVGHGMSGATGAALALRYLDADAVLFASPPLQSSKFNIPERILRESLLNVVNLQSIYYSWYLRNEYTQTLYCDGGGKKCDKLDGIINTLYTTCAI